MPIADSPLGRFSGPLQDLRAAEAIEWFRLGFSAGLPVAHTPSMSAKPYDIRERSLLFAAETVAFCRLVAERDYILRRLAGELVDAAGSVGANLEEAADGQSKPDFISKNCIALKECREARFWLRLIGKSEPPLRRPAAPLIQEANELVAIVTTIIVNAKRTRDRGGSESG